MAFRHLLPLGELDAKGRLWQAVGLDRLLEELLPPGREEIPWATMAAVLVIARLCEPSSELHIAEDWFRRTALDDLLGIADDKLTSWSASWRSYYARLWKAGQWASSLMGSQERIGRCPSGRVSATAAHAASAPPELSS